MNLIKKMQSKISESLSPDFLNKINLLLEEAKKEGLNVGIFEGFRSWDRQNKLYYQGRRNPGKIVTNSPAGYSWHNFGIAADIVFKENGKWSWDLKHDWKKLGEIGKSLGLEWGGSWKKLKDMPHFQFPVKINLGQARALYNKGGLPEVWKNL